MPEKNITKGGRLLYRNILAGIALSDFGLIFKAEY